MIMLFIHHPFILFTNITDETKSPCLIASERQACKPANVVTSAGWQLAAGPARECATKGIRNQLASGKSINLRV